ncbi:hypothetical protein ACFY2R_01475 [Micromonospora olivasterospora]|uniref:Uncharacterized protein n=1 Tax=Micromonospora olivasterospora TaxID=1880 RepID=A0A562ID62_MICOL|nr:hypothetical protein [Micromonospora olivasterospora]TWH68653.1 hypothetical protein JD77_03650 [Micromonospora olivasterospora]
MADPRRRGRDTRRLITDRAAAVLTPSADPAAGPVTADRLDG